MNTSVPPHPPRPAQDPAPSLGSQLAQQAGEQASRALQAALHKGAEQLAARQDVPAWARKMVHLLDDSIRVPGTRFGIGWDAIIGFFFPALGDGVTGVGSVSLLLLALKQRLPTVVIARMVLNILIDTVGGVLPVVGDSFDLFWKSNKRNLQLIERFQDQARARATPADYLFVGLGIVLAVTSVVLSVAMMYALTFGGVVAVISAIRSCGGEGG